MIGVSDSKSFEVGLRTPETRNHRQSSRIEATPCLVIVSTTKMVKWRMVTH